MTEELGGLQSWGRKVSDTTESHTHTHTHTHTPSGSVEESMGSESIRHD